jgi:hypothetical protein
VLQVRATDTGGNVRLSDPIVVDLIADTTPPAVVSVDPADGSNQPASRRKVSVQFSEALDLATIVAANFVLRGPGGDLAPITLDLRQRDTRVDLLFPPLLGGDYQFTIHAAAIKDRVGNPLGAADVTSTFHIGDVTRQPTIRWVNDAGGQWNDENNWRDVATNQPRVPGANDDVLIDVPTNAQISFGAFIAGTGWFSTTVNSIVSNDGRPLGRGGNHPSQQRLPASRNRWELYRNL